MVTLRQVAELAGVSPGTVSRVLNRAAGVERLTPDCVKRVEVAASQLGYRTSYLARSFQQGRSFAIGLLMPSVTPDSRFRTFHAMMVSSADVAVRAHGYHLVTVGPSEKADGYDTALQFLEERRIDALLVNDWRFPDDLAEKLTRGRLPIVALGFGEQQSLPVVGVDDAAGVRRAVEHLADLGHRTILWLGLPLSAKRATERRDACMQTAQSRGMQVHEATADATNLDDGSSIEIARSAVLQALSAPRTFTAIVCYNEILALGAYAALGHAGLRIPEDVSVIGFDDIFGAVSYPPMTTVSHMLTEISVRAVDLTIEMLNDESAWQRLRGQRFKIDPTLVVRRSTARAPECINR